MVSAEQFREWSHGSWLAFHTDTQIDELIIDTRKINEAATALFIAIKTSRRDGHSFLADAYEKGVRNFMVQQPVEAQAYPGANILQVADTLDALQQVIIRYRKQFHIPVIGITGSNGKTIVKEWLYQLLSQRFRTVRSPKSYNSQIGVPLSVWLLEPQDELAIFEAGISQPGEMERLERMIRPDIGVFTNIGAAHSEGFMNQRQKINEKLFLFRNAKQLVYCSDHPELNECIAQYIHQLKGNSSESPLQLFTWSRKHDANLQIRTIVSEKGSTTVTGVYHDHELSITIPFTDPASIENAIHCWCVALLLHVPQEETASGMSQLQPVAMRLELRHGINDCTVINDTYNSDLTSLYIALDYLDQQKQHADKTVVLSDMLQAGKPDSTLYEEVAEAIARRPIKRFIGIGPALYKHKSFFRVHKKLNSVFFKTTEEFLRSFHQLNFEKEAILLKGSRSFTFEKISMLLEQEVHQTILSIDLSALTHNLNVFRTRVAPGVKTMAMVKAFSYGSGSYEIAYSLQYAGVDYLAVAYTDEGIALRKAGITMPIMVMSPDAGSFDRMLAWKLEPEIFNTRSLQAFTQMAATLQVKDYPVHIKLDTGMHRLGFMEHELDALLQDLQQNEQVTVASIFSHLAASEDAAMDDFTQLQAANFRRMSDRIIATLGYTPLRHLCNSAGIARHPEFHFDMVRLGLGLYGIDGSGLLAGELRQVSTLKTTIAQIKDIPVGETVGYGRRGVSDKPLRIATVSIGYADGYPRALGNGRAHMLLHGKEAKLVGVVCMDMCMLDITDIPEAAEGDEVIVFGPQLPLTQLAQWADTIAYEMMTGVSQRVKRVYVNE
jgi:alanine racemase